MALTELQRELCRLLAARRIASGESYVAGGVALNTLLEGSRVSRDIDLFHDTREALQATWDADRSLLAATGYALEVLRERPTFVECRVSHGGESVLLQWVADSAYRFFPLVSHAELGLTLHPFDLATNKVLALVGRSESRDWVDIVLCHTRVQHLGLLAWAASGKDPGLSPGFILDEARRAHRHTQDELDALSFAGSPPDAVELARAWRRMLGEARAIVEELPATEVGKCILGKDGDLFRGTPKNLVEQLARGDLRFHAGSIRGAMPEFRS